MKHYFINRALGLLPTLFGVSILCFALTQLLPGGPADYWFSLASQESFSSAAVPSQLTIRDRRALEEYYGYQEPLHHRYLHWLSGVAKGNWGNSFQHEIPVSTLILPPLKTTLALGALSLVVALLFFLPMGLFQAFHPQSFLTWLSGTSLLFVHALPPFLLALGLLALLSPKSLLVPLICYSFGLGSFVCLLVKQSVTHTRSQEFYRFAQSHGIGRSHMLLRLLRNAAAPLCAQWGTWTTHFFAGSVVIETLFNLNGIGRLGYHALLSRDYPVMLALILLLSSIYLVANLVSELVLAWLDPRVRYA